MLAGILHRNGRWACLGKDSRASFENATTGLEKERSTWLYTPTWPSEISLYGHRRGCFVLAKEEVRRRGVGEPYSNVGHDLNKRRWLAIRPPAERWFPGKPRGCNSEDETRLDENAWDQDLGAFIWEADMRPSRRNLGPWARIAGLVL
ncbi:hypothetical protein E5D57_012986 [Metarhizium anisopliae]|nr:hypothetical protein E5D57_012986 [Metarhizium anisopliae]